MDLIEKCKNADELQMAAGLMARDGSPFAFQFPKVIHELLNISEQMGNLPHMQMALVNSVCGGVRGFSDGKTDEPHIEQEARRLAKEYALERNLKAFYEKVIAFEHASLERNDRDFKREDDFD